MSDPLTSDRRERETDRLRRIWARDASKYDKQMSFWERVLFKDGREWICSQARGEVLEVAAGTGRNFAFYPAGVHLTAIDLSPEMLAIARRRAAELELDVTLREADAQELPFPDTSFDIVVCTLSLCNIPDESLAVKEMVRVLKPGGLLLLLDHVRSPVAPVRWIQRGVEFVTTRIEGDHMLRRPLKHVVAEGLEIVHRERYGWGIVERLAARKPA